MSAYAEQRLQLCAIADYLAIHPQSIKQQARIEQHLAKVLEIHAQSSGNPLVGRWVISPSLCKYPARHSCGRWIQISRRWPRHEK